MLASAVTFWRWLTGQPIALESSDAEPESNDERRVWLRYAANLNIRCEEVNGDADATVPAQIDDISRGGIKVISRQRFEPGTVLSVELPAARGQTPLAVLACVVRAKPHGEREWAMGCRFSGELNEEHLQAFGAAKTRSETPDARGWTRFSCDANVFFQNVSREKSQRSIGRLLNISAAGMALQVPEDVAVGELLSTELRDAAGSSVVNILACVVHVQASDEGRTLGCNFIRELSDKDLQALL